MRANIFGGFSTGRAIAAGYNQCINLYPEYIETQDGVDVGALYSVAGLDKLATIGTGPCKGACYVNNGDNLFYVVSGEKLYSVNSSFTSTEIGAVVSNLDIVQMISNTTQVAIFGGNHNYIYDIPTNTLSNLSLPFSNPITASYQDGFGLANELGTNNWWQSNFKDLSTWQPLNFAQADSKPDPIVAMTSLHRLVYLLNSNSTEVWANAGTAGFSFQRVDGMFIEAGCVATNSLCLAGETMIWLGGNQQGNGLIYLLKGPSSPEIISTQALTNRIQSYSRMDDAIAYSYTQDGHVFYVITFPSGNETWCYDLQTKLWHQRAGFNDGSFYRHRSQCYLTYNGLNLVGDYENGNIYKYNLSKYTNDGEPLKWLRAFEAFPRGESPRQGFTFSSVELMMETGITADSGTTPEVMFRWSDDGGYKWSTIRTESLGLIGETSKRVMWRRTGSTKKAKGMIRVFEFSGTSPIRIAITGCRVNEE